MLLNAWDQHWFLLIMCIGVMYMAISLLMFLFLVPHPRDIGITCEPEENYHEDTQS